MTGPFRFFLGGRDLEMVEIARLLREHAVAFEDRGLAWGARLSDQAGGIAAALARGEGPVAVELADDMPADWAPRPHLTVVDHHGPLAGAGVPTSLEQTFALIGAPPAAWTRWRRLVAANDRGHVAELRATGASPDEIRAVRAADRAAQGVTPAQEAAARTAIAARRTAGRLTRVEADLPSSTAVADFILPELGGPGADRLLVVLPHTLAAFGDGAFVQALAEAMPEGWWGGALPERGFWGAPRTPDRLLRAHRIGSGTPCESA